MTVITTSTVATATAYSNQRKIDRCQNGVLWMTFWNGGTECEFWYSTDDGATWTDSASDVPIGADAGEGWVPVGSFFIDVDDYAHFVYKNRFDGYIYYRRGTPNAARTSWTWSGAVSIEGAFPSNANMDYPDVVAHREGTGWVAHVVYHRADNTTTRTSYVPITITSGGSISGGSRVGLVTTTYGTSAASFPSIDFNHTGDGKTVQGGTPHLYVAWSAGGTGAGKGIRFKKATYSGGSWSWGTEREIDSARYVLGASNFLNCLFDGTRVLIGGGVYDGSQNDTVLHERNAADTTTTIRVLLEDATAANALLGGSVTYDGDGNVYIIGNNIDEAAGNRDLVVRKWVRATFTLEAETVIDSTVGAVAYASAKRGYSDNLIEFVYTDGTSSPYDVIYDSIDLNSPPNAPTLTSPVGSEVVDRGVNQQFNWDFNDPDAGDLQSAYELRYRLVGTSTWAVVSGGAAESHTFSAGTFAAGDYEWQVRTWDNAGEVGPWSGSELFTAADAPTAPSIYDPANNGTVNSNPYPIKWTTAAQDAFQVRTLNDDGAGNPGTVIETSLEIEEPLVRQFSMAFNTNGVVQHAQVRIRVDGLWSVWADSSVKFNVSYTESQPGNLVVTPQSELGRVRLDFFPPTPVGSEPTIVSNDLTRKVNGTVEYIAIKRNLGQSFTYYDYHAEGGVTWEYQVISYADNDTTVYSVPDVMPPMQLVGSWMNDVRNPEGTAMQVIINDNAGDEDYEQEHSTFQTAGHEAPFVEFGESRKMTLDVRFFIYSNQMDEFLALMRSKAVLCYRDFYGRKLFCVPKASPVKRTHDGGYCNVRFTEVHHSEAV